MDAQVHLGLLTLCLIRYPFVLLVVAHFLSVLYLDLLKVKLAEYTLKYLSFHFPGKCGLNIVVKASPLRQLDCHVKSYFLIEIRRKKDFKMFYLVI